MREALRPVALHAVYSSPLSRARETAALVAEPHGLPVVLHDGLREIGVGEWEGLLMDDIERRYGEILRAWWDRPHLTRIPGGETLEELRARGMAAIAAIRAAVPGGAVAVMAHGGVSKVILLTVLGASLSSYWRIRQANACVNVLEYADDHPRVRILNDTTHLAVLTADHGAGPRGAIRSRETW